MLQDRRLDPSAFANKALILAAQIGPVEILDLLLQASGVVASYPDNAPLIAAIRGSQLECLNRLLACPGVRASHPNNQPLLIACETNALRQRECLARLLQVPDLKPHVPDQQPLLRACAMGNPAIVELLLTRPEVNVMHDNYSPVHTAARYRHTTLLAYLLNHPKVDIHAIQVDVLLLAVRDPHSDSVLNSLLNDPRIDPTVYGNQIFLEACRLGAASKIERLLAHPGVLALAHSQDNAALFTAIRACSERGVELLLAIPAVAAQAHTRDNQALFDAIQFSTPRLIELLLHVPNVAALAHTRDNQALFDVIERHHATVVQWFVDLPNMDPSARENQALIDAVQHGQVAGRLSQVSVLDVLLRSPRVDPTARDSLAVYEAARLGRVAMVQTLLARPGVSARRALLGAIAGDCPEVAEISLQNLGWEVVESVVSEVNMASEVGRIIWRVVVKGRQRASYRWARGENVDVVLADNVRAQLSEEGGRFRQLLQRLRAARAVPSKCIVS
eukprot:TRINITY_DN2967_c0_g1_i5.p1 TRINITY_DN2967_c0_g1~~TRINITY_DN2967_c0_g1_i5.p1  ORF type:complete len:504 (-),score=72.38 TRINITY_DN2967_c0_g1_i5:87-1598(-)